MTIHHIIEGITDSVNGDSSRDLVSLLEEFYEATVNEAVRRIREEEED